MMFNAHDNEYSAEEYNQAYNAIRTALTLCASVQNEKRAYILGGQPGSGKSTFYSGNTALDGYVTIDGDQCRKYHPRYTDIVKYDLDNFANRTQPFVNRVIEQLIDDLSTEGYNLIVEGTMRNPNVPIKTCELLKNQGYETQLVVMACDVTKSWNSTIYRAKLMQEIGEKPRLVPIDKYDTIVNSLENSMNTISNRGCFDKINIINRNNELLYRNESDGSPTEILRRALNLDEWNQNFTQHVQEYVRAKIELLEKESQKLNEQEHFSCTYDSMWSRDR